MAGPEPSGRGAAPARTGAAGRALTPEEAALKQAFIAEQGVWSEAHELLLCLDPPFFAAMRQLGGHPWRQGRLEAKVKAFVLIVANANVTHIDEPELRRHIGHALDHGATQDEILEVLECASTVSIHAYGTCLPLLKAHMTPDDMAVDDAVYADLSARFEQERGYWNEVWSDMLRADPGFFSAYTEFSAVPWRRGALSPKVREFMYLAFDASVTHLFVPGTRIHFENAIKYGATIGELLELLQVLSAMGSRAMLSGLPILVEEMARRAAPCGRPIPADIVEAR